MGHSGVRWHVVGGEAKTWRLPATADVPLTDCRLLVQVLPLAAAGCCCGRRMPRANARAVPAPAVCVTVCCCCCCFCHVPGPALPRPALSVAATAISLPHSTLPRSAAAAAAAVSPLPCPVCRHCYSSMCPAPRCPLCRQCYSALPIFPSPVLSITAAAVMYTYTPSHLPG